MLKKILLLGSLVVVALTGCTNRTYMPTRDWNHDMAVKIGEYRQYSASRLIPFFERAGVSYPPKEIALLVFKSTKNMELWARSTDDSRWHYIKTFPVLAASGGPGPKLRDMDHQVPEGIYSIEAMNPDSHFDLSMELNYPNAFDRYEAQQDGRTDLGGDIFIHGNRLSIGCIAIGDDAIQQLFVLAYWVGMHNIQVIVAPNDLRYQKPIYGKERPTWLPQLYSNIQTALVPFKNKN